MLEASTVALRPVVAQPAPASPVPARDRAHRRADWGWLPGLTLVAALGLVWVAIADSGARADAAWAPPIFWIGVVIIFAPAALRLASGEASRRECIGLVVLLTLALYTIKVLHEPLAFTEHDELGHWRGVDNILQTGHLFHPNPIVQAYPAYPGVEIAASALAQLSGLSIFASGTILIAAARLVLGLALYYFMEQVAGLPRIAGLGVALYATNPNFVFFDAQFAYEPFALALGALALLAVARWLGPYPLRRHTGIGRLGVGLLAVLALVGMVVSHHVSSYAVTILLLLWPVAALLARRRGVTVRRITWRVGGLALVSLAATLLWLFLVAGPLTSDELLPVAKGVVSGIGGLLSGGGGGKQVFHASSGQAVEATWAQVLGFASVALVLLLLPFALERAWRHRRRTPVLLVLALAAAGYPVTLALRLTQAGTETANRASEFLFVGIGVLVALTFVELWLPHSSLRARRFVRTRIAVVAVYATVLLIGGVIVGWPPYDRLPGPYLPAAGARSIEPEGVADAYWARAHLPSRSRVLADETDALLMASYGRLNPQHGEVSGLRVPTVFFSRAFTPADAQIIEADHVGYIVVDQRIADVLPLRGTYVEGDEPKAQNHHTPIPRVALTKFDHVPSLGRVLDSGHIAVYATAHLAPGGAG